MPASLLTALLPAPGFLDNLDKSLQEEINSTILLDMSLDVSHCFKCEVRHSPFSDSTTLKNHIENNHMQHFQPSVPDPAVSSLGDYLSSLENKVDHCTKLL